MPLMTTPCGCLYRENFWLKINSKQVIFASHSNLCVFFLNFSIRLNDRDCDGSSQEEDNYESGKSGLKTLNLRLDEVAHIRSALTKAELEGIDCNLRNDIERGKVRPLTRRDSTDGRAEVALYPEDPGSNPVISMLQRALWLSVSADRPN